MRACSWLQFNGLRYAIIHAGEIEFFPFFFFFRDTDLDIHATSAPGDFIYDLNSTPFYNSFTFLVIRENQ